MQLFKNNAQKKLQKDASKCTIKSLRQRCTIKSLRQRCLRIFAVLVGSIHLFPTGFKIHFHDFFKFAPAGKNVHKVEFT